MATAAAPAAGASGSTPFACAGLLGLVGEAVTCPICSNPPRSPVTPPEGPTYCTACLMRYVIEQAGVRSASQQADALQPDADAGGGKAGELQLQAKLRQMQEQGKLLLALLNPMGFHKNTPLAALVVFRACLQWRAFQAEKTDVFDRIIKVIGSQLDAHQDDNACLAYWLTNTVTLLHLLRRNLKPPNGSSTNRRPVAAAAGRIFMEELFGRPPRADEASIQAGDVEGFRLVEGKYPVLLFIQQLDACVQKIFPVMRENIKKSITLMLGQFIYTPPSAKPELRFGTTSPQYKASSDILLVLDDLLIKLKDNHVPKPMAQALYKQLFVYMDVQLFNQLLLRRECCSFSNSKQVKACLVQLESWIKEHGTEWVGNAWDELGHISQAVTLLAAMDKPKLALDGIKKLCPTLMSPQLFRICSIFWDHNSKEEPFSSKEFLEAIPEDSGSYSFLLDDDSTLPFVVDEVVGQMDIQDWHMAMQVPEALKTDGDASSFAFLEVELHLGEMSTPP